jgi:NAD(P)-dependent dehydrogenase (short-subunit alcohol dehydrogenase family)
MAEWTGVAGKRVLVTGATRGIGLAAARELAAEDAKLAIVARDEGRAKDAVAEIRASGGPDTQVDVLSADLASQASVRRLAAEALECYSKIDVLVNNAGAMFARREFTVDGIERTWAVNHLAPFLLTTLLLDRLQESAPARIVTTASDAHRGAHVPFEDLDGERSYGVGGFGRYGQTKLANILFTAELARRLKDTGVTANCFHPGLVASGFNRNNGPLMSILMTAARPFSRSTDKGAETMVWLADSPEVSLESGGYFVDKHRATPTKEARDMGVAERLWKLSEEQTQAAVARTR